jgi:hypothetical protein
VVDLALLAAGQAVTPPTRFVVVRADGAGDRVAALAVGAVVGLIEMPEAAHADLDPLLAMDGAGVSGVGVADGCPMAVLDTARIVPAAVWARLAGVDP